MQKAKVICIILAIVLVSTGTVLLIDNLSGNATELVRPSDTMSATMEKPQDGVFSQDNAKDNLYIAHGELIRSGGFRGQNRGTSKSLGITQTVWSDRTVVGNNVWKQSVSDGLVKMGSQTYIWGENYVFLDMKEVKAVDNVVWQNSARRVSKETYDETYGYRFSELTGYILNDNTIKEAYLESAENGVYRYRYILDEQTAPYYVLFEMRNNAGLNTESNRKNGKGFATFQQAEIIVEMDANWQIKTLSTDCKYKVPMLGGVDCEEHMTETFYDIGYTGDLPNKDFFEPYLEAEIVKPEEKDPDALNVLMDMFEPYLTGSKLNAQLSVNNGGAELLKLKLSLGLDITNLENITADVLVGNNLYLSYQKGSLYVTYGGFKGSTTVDGITALVSPFLPEKEAGALAEINPDELLKAASFEKTADGCVVSLPIKLSETLSVDAKLYGKTNGDAYAFSSATVSIGEVSVQIGLDEGFAVPELSGEYPEILGLLDIVNNGVINADVDVNGFKANVAYDMANAKLVANAGDLQAVLQNETLYAQYGEIKVKAALSDIETLTALFGDLFGKELPKLELPELNTTDILAVLGQITAETTDSGVAFNLKLGDAAVKLSLINADGKWNLKKIDVSYGEIKVGVTPAVKAATFPEINEKDYNDVTQIAANFALPIASLISAENYGADISLTLDVNGVKANVNGNLVYDKNGSVEVDALVSVNGGKLIKANVIYAGDTLFLYVNGVKAAVSLSGGSVNAEQIKQAVDKIYGVNDTLDGVINQIAAIVTAVKNFDVSKLDITQLITSFKYQGRKLTLGVDATAFGLGEFTVALGAQGSKLTAEVIGLNIGSAVADVTVKAYDAKQPITVPETSDYVLNLKGSVGKAEFTVSADFAAMDIAASVTILGETVNVRFADNVIYVKAGNVALKASVSEIGGLVSKISALIPSLTAKQSGGLGDLFANLSNLTAADLLNALKVSAEGEKLSVSLQLNGISAAVNFNDTLLTDISLNVANYTVSAALTDEQAEKLDVNGEYISLSSLVNRAAEIINAYKDVANSGISANIAANVKIGEAAYAVKATANYNGGLYVGLQLANLVNAKIYIVDNTLYADVNGIKVASALPQNNSANSINAAAVLGTLNKLYGYNDVLDGVLDVVTAIPQKLQNIDCFDLISDLTYENGKLAVTVDASQLNLGQFTITLAGTQSVTVSLDKLAIGGVSLNGTIVNAAPQCEPITAPNASDYVTELQIDVLGYTAYAKLDLYSKTAEVNAVILGEQLDLLLKNNVVYVSYGNVNAKLDLADINALMGVIGKFVNIELPCETPDVKTVLNNLTVTMGDKTKLSVVLDKLAASITLNNDASIDKAEATLAGVTATAKLCKGKQYKQFDLTQNYVNLADVAQTFADDIHSLVNAQGYYANVKGEVAFGNHIYKVEAAVNYNQGLYVFANVAYNNVTILKGEIYVVDNVLYMDADNVRLAVALPKTKQGKAASWQDTLSQALGYNAYADKLINLVLSIANTAKLNDIPSVIAALAFDGETLTLTANGSVYGLGENILLTVSQGINVAVCNLTYQDISLNLSGSVAASQNAVTAPQGDYTTNLQIKIDEKNTVYANLDLINNVYRLRLDTLNVLYKDGAIRINYNDELLVKTNLDEMKNIIARFNEIAGDNAQFGESGAVNLGNIDLKAIAATLSIVAENGVATVGATLMGIPVSVNFTDGAFQAVLPVNLISKRLIVTADEKRAYAEFTADESQYVAIEDIINDYFPVLEKLAKTKSWHFDINAQIDVTDAQNVAAQYLLNNSYVEFVYDKVNNIFELRVCLNILKQNGGEWVAYKTVELAYFDNRVFVNYNGLKITLSLESIRSCLTNDPSLSIMDALNAFIANPGKGNAIMDELVTVIPQIKDAIVKYNEAKNQFTETAARVNYASILKKAGYQNGVFSLTVDGGIFAEGLGDISLSVGVNGDALCLTELELTYGNVSVNGVTASVSAKDEQESRAFIQSYPNYFEIDGAPAGNAEKGEAYHINLDSIKQLLSSFVVTAADRSFYVSGNVHVVMLGIVDVDIRLGVRVDINQDNKSFITAKIERDKLGMADIKNAAFEDYGGTSYLYYDGVTGLFGVVRNSYRTWCTKCNNWCDSGWHLAWRSVKMRENDYRETDISTEKFSADVVGYILKMVNFKSWINDKITGSINGENTNEFGIEDIIKDYAYTSASKQFYAKVDLKPISSSLGEATLAINHNDNSQLTDLQVKMNLISICDLTLDLQLNPVTAGYATQVVADRSFW